MAEVVQERCEHPGLASEDPNPHATIYRLVDGLGCEPIFGEDEPKVVFLAVMRHGQGNKSTLHIETYLRKTGGLTTG